VIAALDDRCEIAAMRIPPKRLSAIAAEGMIVPVAVRALDRYAADLGSDIRPVTAWASHLRYPHVILPLTTTVLQPEAATSVPDAPMLDGPCESQ
jgi:hypothetical protein